MHETASEVHCSTLECTLWMRGQLKTRLSKKSYLFTIIGTLIREGYALKRDRIVLSIVQLSKLLPYLDGKTARECRRKRQFEGPSPSAFDNGLGRSSKILDIYSLCTKHSYGIANGKFISFRRKTAQVFQLHRGYLAPEYITYVANRFRATSANKPWFS